jgi:hypothetical protein
MGDSIWWTCVIWGGICSHAGKLELGWTGRKNH